ncbi:MAG: nucleotide exchange factor GrpE [Candidatus Pacebacteria bacterium]|nr:nucleotide exchange factor GrpE [Candidatus Paceibacterota bacterium]PIR60975.1 MAG: nucleotide exchange factor GrpE [Candidatus Pacebacteria bacterium CG10_big_fil_rev_8_21_14_0_10_45_6]
MSKKNTPPVEKIAVPEVAELEAQVAELVERERRLQADYQNIVRRTREEKLQHSKLATKHLLTDLLDPLAHLSLASEQLADPGLQMVIDQLWKTLQAHGLEQIEVIGKPFDAATMEAVEAISPDITTPVATTVVRPGFTLNGEILQHAKVVVG